MPPEILSVEFLDCDGVAVAKERFGDGAPDRVIPPLRRIVGKAIEFDAAAIAISHNHPSGIARPSPADHAFTKKLVKALHPLDIRVHDHVIVTAAGNYSFRAEGLL